MVCIEHAQAVCQSKFSWAWKWIVVRNMASINHAQAVYQSKIRLTLVLSKNRKNGFVQFFVAFRAGVCFSLWMSVLRCIYSAMSIEISCFQSILQFHVSLHVFVLCSRLIISCLSAQIRHSFSTWNSTWSLHATGLCFNVPARPILSTRKLVHWVCFVAAGCTLSSRYCATLPC